MKYEIETLHLTITDENMEDLDEILFGEPMEVITDSEGSLLMDEEEARKEFDQLCATARKQEDGSIEIYIPTLVRGEEELEEDVLEEYGEEAYYLPCSEEIDVKEFDEASWELFRKMGYEKES